MYRYFLSTISITFCTLLLFSCANTVTDTMPTLEMKIYIELNKTPLSLEDEYNYYIIFSDKENIKVPLNEDITNTTLYFPAPGMNYTNSLINNNPVKYRSIETFYTDFFDSWTNYIIINNSKANALVQLYNAYSPDTPNTYFSNPDDHHRYEHEINFVENNDYSLKFNDNNNTIVLEFNLAHLSNTKITSDIVAKRYYIQVITSKRTVEGKETGHIIDRLNEPISIVLSTDEREAEYSNVISITEENNALDIKKCTISIH